MKKIILLSAILFSCSCLAQNGTTIVYNTAESDLFGPYKTGMIVSGSFAITASVLMVGAANEKEDADKALSQLKAGYYLLGAAGAALIVSNAFLLPRVPRKNISLSINENGIGLRWRL